MAIYRLIRNAGVSFDPEAIEAMGAAYEAVCEELGIAGKKNDRVTEIVALKIFEAAQTGEHDPTKLRKGALDALGISERPKPKPLG